MEILVNLNEVTNFKTLDMRTQNWYLRIRNKVCRRVAPLIGLVDGAKLSLASPRAEETDLSPESFKVHMTEHQEKGEGRKWGERAGISAQMMAKGRPSQKGWTQIVAAIQSRQEQSCPTCRLGQLILQGIA